MKYDLFLCHNSQDKASVRAINEVLRQEFDLRTFLDESTLVGGEEWAAAIQGALADSAGCAVLIGENGWGQYQLDSEARPAMLRRQNDPGFRLIPVILPGAVEAAMAELPELFKSRHWVDLKSGVSDAGGVRALAFAARGENPFPEGKPQLTAARLRFDAIRWDAAARRDDSILYTGAELREAEALSTARRAELPDLVMAFLETSRIRLVERRGQYLATHASALAQDQLPLAARLAALSLEHRPSPEAHAVLRKAAGWLPVTVEHLQHADRVTDILASSDDSLLLTAADDGSVRVWDAERLELLREVRHESKVNALAMDPAGEWFAAGGEDGCVSVWNTSGERLKTLKVGQPIARIDVREDDDRCWLVAVGGEMLPGSPGIAVAWDASSWNQAWRNAKVRDAAIAAGGTIAVLAINDHFVMVNNSSGAVAGDAALNGQVTAVAAHPAAPVFLATTLTRNLYRIAIDGDEFKGGVISENALAIERGAFSPDGSRIAVFGADKQLTIFGPRGLELSVPYEGMFGLRITFAPASSLVVIHSAEAKSTTLWHTSTRTRVSVLATEGTAGAVFGFPPRLAVAVAEHGVAVVRLPLGEEARWSHGGFTVIHMVFSPDGRFVARNGASQQASDGRVDLNRQELEVIDAASGEIVAHLEDVAEIRARAFTSDGTSLYFEKDGRLMSLHVAKQKVKAVNKPIAATPEPRVVGAELNAPAIGEAVQRRGMKGASISPDGRCLCILHDRHMFSLWDVAEMKETLVSSTAGEPGPVVFTAEGNLVAIGDERGNVIVCSAGGEVLARFKHAEPILGMLFSPDSRFLAVASADSAFRLWAISLDALASQIEMPLTLDREEWAAYVGDEPYPY